jgi:uncharacterized membrane protein
MDITREYVRFLDLVSIVLIGLMIGNELGLSVFVNPALGKLEDGPQAKSLSLLARSLGKAMPYWYALSAILVIAEAYLRRHMAHASLLFASATLFVFVILYTVIWLVPINKRIAGLNSDLRSSNWKQEHRHWDKLHRVRVVLLTAAMACLVWSLV